MANNETRAKQEATIGKNQHTQKSRHLILQTPSHQSLSYGGLMKATTVLVAKEELCMMTFHFLNGYQASSITFIKFKLQ